MLSFSRQAFYRWRRDSVCDRHLVDAYATNAAFDVHAEDPGFGYRFIADELADAGYGISERRVWRLCSQAGIVSRHARKRGKNRRPGQPVHDEPVGLDFTADRPNRLWLTDITEHPTGEGTLYLCAVEDAWSPDRRLRHRRPHNLASGCRRSHHGHHPTRRRPCRPGCVVHSDRGSQSRSRRYVQTLERHQLSGSMGRVASSAAKAAIENLFALLQKNVLHSRRWTTRHELRLAIVT